MLRITFGTCLMFLEAAMSGWALADSPADPAAMCILIASSVVGLYSVNQLANALVNAESRFDGTDEPS